MARLTPTSLTSTYAAVAALNANFDDIAALFEQCIFRDGRSPNQMETNLNLNHFKVENVLDGTAATDAANVGQVMDLIADQLNLAVVDNPMVPVASRAAMAALANTNFPAFLTESGREGSFAFDSSDLSAEVTADTRQGVYVPPISDTTGATGAWVRKFAGPLQLEWFDVSNDGFASLIALAAFLDKPAVVNSHSVQLVEQHSAPAGLKLLIDGGELYIDDDTLESAFLVETDDVFLGMTNNGQIRGPLTTSAGVVGAPLIVRGTSNFRGKNIKTKDGKYGAIVVDNDDLFIDGIETGNSYDWGIVVGGNRNFRFKNGWVDTTRNGTGTDDLWKIFGQDIDGISTRTQYNGEFISCGGTSAGFGQTFDLICSTDQEDDMYNLTFFDPIGRECPGGFFEMKVTEDVTVNYPMHGIYIYGGVYNGGNGVGDGGLVIKDRIFDIVVDGTRVNDAVVGLQTAAACRQVRIKNFTSVRSRQEGIKWIATSPESEGNQLINPTVIDANYGQVSSLYAGIRIQDSDGLLLQNPTVGISENPADFAHTYGIEVVGGVTRLNIHGNVSLQGHATAAVNNAGTDTFWPETIQLPEINLASGSGGTNVALAVHRPGFVVCSMTVMYSQASNVGRDITFVGRDTTTSTSIATYSTDAAALLYTTAEVDLATPVRLGQTRQALVASVGADPDYPGSPTGKIIVHLHGYRDAANLS